MDGKSSIPSQLAEFDITNAVKIFDSELYNGLFFNIYRGAWKLDTPRIFQVVVAIKDFRFEQQEFENRLIKFLTTWAGLTHDNLVPFLGVIDFGDFPAVITSWMTNGTLSEYIKKEEEYDKMELVIGVARGVAYLHLENIVHSDIRGLSVFVDELGQARLADPGLLCVLADRSLIVSLSETTEVYRWMAPELLEDSLAKATFATDVYSVTMTSLEIFTAEDPFEDVPDTRTVTLIRQVVNENKRPVRPDDVDDNLWSLWGEGWNQDAAMRPNMENYVARLTQLV